MGRTLAEALADRPLFFEPLPPSARSAPKRAEAHVEEVVRLLSAVPRLDAVDVPELVDENHDGRPFYRSANPPGFARAVGDRVGCEVVVNKVVAHLGSPEAVEQWAREMIAQGVRNTVLVGGSSRYIPYPGPSVTEADRICRPLLEAAGGRLGNIAIPQRTGEAHRMLSKTRAGASFFTTQIVFDGESVLQMVREYNRLCAQAGLTPAALLLSLAPLADDGDAEFIRWLGADIPEAAERTILNGDESAATARSIDHALRVWEHVRAGIAQHSLVVPVGVNVEQITSRHVGSAGEMLRAFASALDAPVVPAPGP
jgi:5,10-methylenetetrahydrofolate reductase